MGEVYFERRILIKDYYDIQCHGFCDASNSGYGACVYIRSSGACGNTITRLLSAKSRVAPLKTTTIPRLELCGALLLAKLFREVKSATGLEFNKIVFWCDFTIVLHWLRTQPQRLKTYVANRVVEIQEITRTHVWRHVGTADNPADAISRGQLPHTFLRNATWFAGPSWLHKDESEWPNEMTHLSELPELKKNTCLMTTPTDLYIFEKYSSYSKLIRIVAYCLRWRSLKEYSGSLCAKEINRD